MLSHLALTAVQEWTSTETLESATGIRCVHVQSQLVVISLSLSLSLSFSFSFLVSILHFISPC
jgi:hypothetical protein